MKKLIGLLLIFSLFCPLLGQAKQVDQKEVEKNSKEIKIKSWKLPVYMHENLRYMIDDFNRSFNERIEFYKAELKKYFPEFKNMPTGSEDIILDLELGRFFLKDDYTHMRLRQQEIKKEIAEGKNKDKAEKKK